MMRRRLLSARSGASAAELALAMPLLLILLFGTFEVGNYFLSEHVVQKAVRDASRYASRLPLTSYSGCALTSDAEEDIQLVAKAGDPDGDWDEDSSEDQRLPGWDDKTMTTVTVACDTSGTYTGMYASFPTGVPVVTVKAAVPYPTLFATLGINIGTLTLNATSQA